MRISHSDGWAVLLPGTHEVMSLVGINLTEHEAKVLQQRWPKSLLVAPSIANVLALETEPYAIVPPTKSVTCDWPFGGAYQWGVFGPSSQ